MHSDLIVTSQRRTGCPDARSSARAEAPAYDIRREGEDIAAVAEAAGGDGYLVAHSYGALCALEAVQVTKAVSRLVAYEPPRPEPGRTVVGPAARSRMRAAEDPGKILEIFLQEALRLPPADVEAMPGQAHQAMDFDPDQFTEAVFSFSRD
jgi:pimeloyl-ACP methyl ester carboxylesterase